MMSKGLDWGSRGWQGNDNAAFQITDNWDGYSIGFDNITKNGEFNKFVVDITHTRDAESYKGSFNNIDQATKNKYNALDSSLYNKKDLNGNLISSFYIDGVQTVDNLWGNKDDKTIANYADFVGIQGNTLAPDNAFFSIFGGESRSFVMDVFVTAGASTLSGINILNNGKDPSLSSDSARWLTHQATKDVTWQHLYSDGCIVNTDTNQAFINSSLSDWSLFKGFNMGSIIKEDWSNYYENYTW